LPGFAWSSARRAATSAARTLPTAPWLAPTATSLGRRVACGRTTRCPEHDTGIDLKSLPAGAMFGLAVKPTGKIFKWPKSLDGYRRWRKLPYSTNGNMREVRYCLRGTPRENHKLRRIPKKRWRVARVLARNLIRGLRIE
jgi:hypothetical protein